MGRRVTWTFWAVVIATAILASGGEENSNTSRAPDTVRESVPRQSPVDPGRLLGPVPLVGKPVTDSGGAAAPRNIISPDRRLSPGKQPQAPQPADRTKPSATSPGVVMVVNATRLNVREGPGTDFRTIRTLAARAEVRVVSQQGPWAQVETNGLSGWVAMSYLARKEEVRKPERRLPTATPPVARTGPTDSEIIRDLIARSIAGYSGNCPCPYNTMRNGRSCGRSSAYSRPGGAAPLCYPRDVTAEMIARYRARR